ncbi:30S ribosomal protein S7 [Bacteroidota bacterium]|jgi:small subunit ribosomal protein S7|nr:30S ribosomal protein S7 [Balneola sp.]MBL6868384.1 30S ribosomal protein S7 [Cryomorphaceae bacterium]MCH1552155.1 30S ribosomal protein S7 [Balneolaceae bacterium]MDA0736742.1 30S ribosomal protein S7 [Bacteroidota bacterium]OUX48322.1 MAG: 30S ribosomal protein S7 [Bacteroidetes bacterium TMED284]CAI8373920.1 MAG: 30S ribosomal protein S7 [Rhodothermaeota bacterium MED-G12]|tara:strand:- start:970 stop:1437 length:468 start_codon:yes stop_codon:yes gene_type:complete
MRRRKAEKRDVQPDPIFDDKLITRFVNNLMRDGKKSVARKIVYQAFEIIEERTGETGVEVFRSALQNSTPVVEVKSRRVGGATYQVPVEVRQERGTALGMRWLIKAARSRNDKSMSLRLSRELIDASKNEGGAVRKKDETHRMAEANKAFAHFRF